MKWNPFFPIMSFSWCAECKPDVYSRICEFHRRPISLDMIVVHDRFMYCLGKCLKTWNGDILLWLASELWLTEEKGSKGHWAAIKKHLWLKCLTGSWGVGSVKNPLFLPPFNIAFISSFQQLKTDDAEPLVELYWPVGWPNFSKLTFNQNGYI